MNITFIPVLIFVILHLIFLHSRAPSLQLHNLRYTVFVIRLLDRYPAQSCAYLRQLAKGSPQLPSSYSTTCAYLRESAQTRVNLRILARTRGSPSRIPRAYLLGRAALGLVYIAGYPSHTCRLDMTFISPFDLPLTPKHPFSARHLYRISYPWLFV